MSTINYRFVMKRGAAAEWAAANTVLLQGEYGLITDAADDMHRIKIGDGTTAWTALAFFTPTGGGDLATNWMLI